jgi:hypothetical protein
MPSTPARPVKDPRARRLLISLSWVILQAAILIALAYACAMTAALLAAGAFGGHGTGPAVTVGMLGGITAALVVNHRARGWLTRLRLGRLRVKGVQAKAVVVKCDWDMSTGRGVAIARYTVLVRWVDPATGVPWQGDRGYRFAGLGSRRFEAACAHGAVVPVYYPPNRPSRFIIDVPFAPVMADIVPLLPATGTYRPWLSVAIANRLLTEGPSLPGNPGCRAERRQQTERGTTERHYRNNQQLPSQPWPCSVVCGDRAVF